MSMARRAEVMDSMMNKREKERKEIILIIMKRVNFLTDEIEEIEERKDLFNNKKMLNYTSYEL
jgi:hypothetical protein